MPDQKAEQLYKPLGEAQLKQLAQNHQQNLSAIEAGRQSAAQNAAAALKASADEAARTAKSIAGVKQDLGLTAQASPQLDLSMGNRAQQTATTIQNAQQDILAEIGREQDLLGRIYEQEINKAKAQNDRATAQVLYNEAKSMQEKLRRRQEAAAKLMLSAGDSSLAADAYGLSDSDAAKLHEATKPKVYYAPTATDEDTAPQEEYEAALDHELAEDDNQPATADANILQAQLGVAQQYAKMNPFGALQAVTSGSTTTPKNLTTNAVRDGLITDPQVAKVQQTVAATNGILEEGLTTKNFSKIDIGALYNIAVYYKGQYNATRTEEAQNQRQMQVYSDLYQDWLKMSADPKLLQYQGLSEATDRITFIEENPDFAEQFQQFIGGKGGRFNDALFQQEGERLYSLTAQNQAKPGAEEMAEDAQRMPTDLLNIRLAYIALGNEYSNLLSDYLESGRLTRDKTELEKVLFQRLSDPAVIASINEALTNSPYSYGKTVDNIRTQKHLSPDDPLITAEDLTSMWDTWERMQNAEEENEKQKNAQNAAGNIVYDIFSSILSVPANVLGGAGNFLATEIGENLLGLNINGNYNNADPYGWQFAGTNYANRVRSAVGGNLEETYGSVAGNAYQGLMSVADSVFASAITGGHTELGAALLSTASYSSSFQAARARGASDEQARTFGLAAGAFEYGFEKLSLDVLKGNSKAASKNIADFFLKGLRFAGAEVPGELLTDIATEAADRYINQNFSAYEQRVQQLIAEGNSQESAQSTANKEFGEGLWDTLIATTISSLFFAGSAEAGARYNQRNNVTPQMPVVGDYNASGAPIFMSQQQAIEFQEAKAAQAEAQQRQQAQQAAGPLYGTVIGDVLVQGPAESGQYSNRQAETILADQASVDYLSYLGGFNIGDYTTKSQKRAVIKQALSKLSDNVQNGGYLAFTLDGNVQENTQADTQAEAQAAQTVPQVVAQEQSAPTAPTEVAQPTQQTADPVSAVAIPAQQKQAQARQNAQTAARAMQQAFTPAQNANESVGAADRNFTGLEQYNSLLTDDNVQPDRATDVRPDEVPILDAAGNKVSEFAKNVIGARSISDRDATEAKKLVAMGAASHQVQHMEDVSTTAKEHIDSVGAEAARGEIRNAVVSGKASEHDVAVGIHLLVHYSNQNTADAQAKAGELMVEVSQMATDAGRTLNMFGLLRRLTPEGKYAGIKRQAELAVERANRSRSRRKKIKGIDIPKDLHDAYIRAQKAFAKDNSEANRQRVSDAETAIIQYVAAQIPGTLQEKLDALRNCAMLLNPKTHLRNIISTATFKPIATASNKLSAILQRIFIRDKNLRTRGIVGLGKEGRAITSWARQDAKAQQERLGGSAYLGDTIMDAIEAERTIFGRKGRLGRISNAVNKFSRDSLYAEDVFWKKSNYRTSLAGFLQARGITAEMLENGTVDKNVLEEGRRLAINDAARNTFNDRSKLAEMFGKLRYNGDHIVGKSWNLLYKGLVPFVRVTANITTRMAEYSPANFLRNIYDIGKLKNGEIDAATYIDRVAQSLTGTGLVALGYALASGVFGVKLVGEADDEEKAKGATNWSLKVGDDYYSIEWLAPSVTPLFMGAKIQNLFDPENENTDPVTFTDALSSFLGLFEPVLELSMMSAVSDTIDDFKYANSFADGFITAVTNAGLSYFGQFVPTAFGQIEQLFETNKKQAYSDNADPFMRQVELFLGRLSNRLPGVDLFQKPTLDTFGQPVGHPDNAVERIYNSFFRLSNKYEGIENPVMDEVSRINDVLGNKGNVTPNKFPQKFDYTDKDGVQHSGFRPSAEDYNRMAYLSGATTYAMLSALIDDDAYQALPDDVKADVFKAVYSFSDKFAKTSVMDDYQSTYDKWMEGMVDEGGNLKDNAVEQLLGHYIESSIAKEIPLVLGKIDASEAGATDLLDQYYDSYMRSGEDLKALVYDQLDGKSKAFVDAREANATTDEYIELYATYKEISENDDLSETQKGIDWAKAVDDAFTSTAKKNAFRENLAFWQHFPTNTDRYDNFVSVGLSPDAAYTLTQTISYLKPAQGKSTVTDGQRWDAVVKSNVSDFDKEAALFELMSDSQDEKFQTAIDRGIDAADYVDAYNAQVGKKKTDAITSIQGQLGISYTEALALYKIFHP